MSAVWVADALILTVFLKGADIAGTGRPLACSLKEMYQLLYKVPRCDMTDFLPWLLAARMKCLMAKASS